MSLPLDTLTFYRLADQAPAASSVAGFHDAIYAALGSTTDYRGTSIASTHLWGRGRYQNAGVTEAVWATPPSGTPMTLNPTIIWAGAGSGTPTMQTDTFSANVPMLGIHKNSGAFNAWTAALPMTSGQWSGFNRAAPTNVNSTGATVRVFISQEVIVVHTWWAATSHVFMIAGAILEGYSDNPLAIESDDRLYGCITHGSGGAVNGAFLSNANFLDHNTTTAGSPHAFIFAPGSSTVYTMGRTTRFASAAAALCEQDSAGAFIGEPLHFGRSTTSNTITGAKLGRLREIYALGAVQGGQTRRSGSTDLFHVIGVDNTTADDAIALKAVA